MSTSKMLDVYEAEMGVVCDKKDCTRQATHILTVHCIDHCTQTGTPVSGNKDFLLCPACAESIFKKVGNQVGKMRDAAAQHNKSLDCMGCGMPIGKLADVLTIERLIPSRG